MDVRLFVSNGMGAHPPKLHRSMPNCRYTSKTTTYDILFATVGIDLDKNVFQLLGVNEYGKTIIKKINPPPEPKT